MPEQADLLVVGGGIMGAPAAFFAARAGARVTVVAAPEPTTPESPGTVFGAHYDQTRLLWRWHDDAVATALAARSVELLQQMPASGLAQPVGALYLADPGRADPRLARAQQPDPPFAVEPLTAAAIRSRWPQLGIPDEAAGFYEPPPSGLLDPRALVAAFLQASGAEIIGDTATSIAVGPSGVTVSTKQSGRQRAARVLLAAGAFTNRPGLLERALRLRLKTETVVFAEIDADQAQALAGIPPIHYDNEPGHVAEIYTAPPTQTPDGRWRLKLGANTTRDRWLADTDAAAGWYRTHPGIGTPLKLLRDAMLRLYPGLDCTVWATERCVITYTAHGHPYVGSVVPGRLYVATGGNGGAAKLGPALGELAARVCLEDMWPTHLPPEWFRVVYHDEDGPWAGQDLLAVRRSQAAADQG